MGRQAYCEINLSQHKLDTIGTMNEIVDEYVAQGYRLTVRQLYYQMVARGYIENTVQSYKRLASIINDGKMVGMIDWDAIEDRTREFIRRQRWSGPGQILHAAADSFHMDLWLGQDHRCFVIVEKEALAGVLEGVCNELDVPLLAARGYPSGTVLREFAESDLIPCWDEKARDFKQLPVIIHLGDHDPSGIDMSRDLAERFYTFITGRQSNKRLGDKMFQRVALNMDQIEDLRPPPNPAKTTDARFKEYRKRFGDESWELDALKPDYLVRLVRETVGRYIESITWKRRKAHVEQHRAEIKRIAADFENKGT